MKVYLVEDYNYDKQRVFSTLDKAKEFCCKLVKSCEEEFFNKEMMEFNERENRIYVDYDSDNVAIIISYELDKD